MSLLRQTFIVMCCAGLAVVAYVFFWPLAGPGGGQPGAPGGARTGQPVDAIVEPVELVRERARIQSVGTAEAVRSATLFAATAGEVVALSIEPNRKVETGDVLLELDHRAEALAVELARVEVQAAQQLLRRYEGTGGSGAVPESTVDDARSAVALARIRLRQAEVALADRRVVAPFPGHVGMTPVDVGDRIGPGEPITTLDDRSALLVSFEVPELHLERVAIGDPIAVSTWAERAVALEGRIVDLSSRVDPASRSFIARARVPNPDDRLRPGMSFAVTLDLYGPARPLVPEVAVQWGADGAHLWAVRGGRAERVPVRVVQRQEGVILVDAALAAGEPVVVEGVQRMRPGIEVNFVPPLGPAT